MWSPPRLDTARTSPRTWRHHGTAFRRCAVTAIVALIMLTAWSAQAARPGVPVSGETLASSSPVPVPDVGPLGVDVANYQGDVPWSTVYAEGVRWAYIKATQGTHLANSYFQQQYEGAYEAGIIRGAYEYATPNTSSGSAQASFFAKNGGGWSADGRTLPGMVDLEPDVYPLPSSQKVDGPASCYGMDAAQMVSWIRSFVDTYESAVGRWPVIYTGTSWWDTCTNNSAAFGDGPYLLTASWPYPSDLSSSSRPSALPPSWRTYTMWQFYAGGSLPKASGVIAAYDQDVFNGTYAQLQEFALNTTVQATAGVQWSEPSTVSQGSASRTDWSFKSLTSMVGYQGWAQSWDKPATTPQFITNTGGWMMPGSLPLGTHTPVVTFFVNGVAYPDDGPSVTVTAWTPPTVTWNNPASVPSGSQTRIGWSFPSLAGTVGYQGWAQSWDKPATTPQFITNTGGWMIPGSLPLGTHTPIITFFVDGVAHPVDGPSVTVTAWTPPTVTWTDPVSVAPGSSTPIDWSFPSLSNVTGYQGWAQSWDKPATTPQFQTNTGGWMIPGSLPLGTHTPIITFFVNGTAYPVDGPTITTSHASVVPTVTWTDPVSVPSGSQTSVGWSFPSLSNVTGYQGWAQSWDKPATTPQFQTNTGGWMIPGSLPLGTHTPIITFFVNGTAHPVDGPTITVTG